MPNMRCGAGSCKDVQPCSKIADVRIETNAKGSGSDGYPRRDDGRTGDDGEVVLRKALICPAGAKANPNPISKLAASRSPIGD
jgi:hypothetical protein